MNEFFRAWPLDDVHVRSGGSGRTVDAYLAVFDTPTEVSDQDGRYREQLHRASFNKTLADNALRFPVIYNHAMTLHGTPSDRFSVPVGRPVEITPDGRGVRVVDEYHRTELADEVLEAIRDGSVRAYSFSGRFVRSDPRTPRMGFRPAADGSLRAVTRLEVALREYGPTPLPAYADAAVLGVRGQLLGALLAAPAEERLSLLQQLTHSGPGSTSTPAAGGAGDDGAAEQAERAAARHFSRHDLRDRIRRARITRGI
jgi:HK97 family phage prohead protease